MAVDQKYADGSPLGDHVDYSSSYDPSLLHAIERSAYRQSVDGARAVWGVDRWVCYELSWLDQLGKPEVAILTIDLPADSPCIVESKSLKLYLNSFNGTRFESRSHALETIEADLSRCTKSNLFVSLANVQEIAVKVSKTTRAAADTVLIDDLPVECSVYQRDPTLLRLDDQRVTSQRMVSHLFRSNCPVTNQPDWASIYIDYTGQQINAESLLQYIVSYREHQGFHEQCVEQVYSDLIALTGDTTLQVQGRFTRRGGIEINPVRGGDRNIEIHRINRQ